MCVLGKSCNFRSQHRKSYHLIRPKTNRALSHRKHSHTLRFYLRLCTIWLSHDFVSKNRNVYKRLYAAFTLCSRSWRWSAIQESLQIGMIGKLFIYFFLTLHFHMFPVRFVTICHVLSWLWPRSTTNAVTIPHILSWSFTILYDHHDLFSRSFKFPYVLLRSSVLLQTSKL